MALAKSKDLERCVCGPDKAEDMVPFCICFSHKPNMEDERIRNRNTLTFRTKICPISISFGAARKLVRPFLGVATIGFSVLAREGGFHSKGA